MLAACKEAPALDPLAPPPVVDPAAPMIARTERIAVDAPLARTYAYVVEGPLERMIPVTRRLPGVTGATLLTEGPWGGVGQRRHVHLTDGARTTEQVLEAVPNERFHYEVWDYTSPAARAVAYAIGEFRFAGAGADRTQIAWTYAFRLRPDVFPGNLGGFGRRLMRLAFIDTAYAELMRAALAAIRAELEAAA